MNCLIRMPKTELLRRWSSVCTGTIDESPMAYKPMEEIVRLIEPTVDILYFVKPKINIKATDEE